MSVTNYWKNYYLNTEGKLKRRKKTFVPKYLSKKSDSFNFGHSVVEETPALNRPRGIFEGTVNYNYKKLSKTGNCRGGVEKIYGGINKKSFTWSGPLCPPMDQTAY